MKKQLKTITVAGLATLASIMPMTKVHAQDVTGDVGVMIPKETKDSYAEINAFYGLPANSRGHTVLNMYNQGEFFGKTSVTTPLHQNVNLRTQAVHADELLSSIGVGIGIPLTNLPGNFSGEVRIMPFWMTEDGHKENDARVGYFIAGTLPGVKNGYALHHAEANVAHEKGPSFAYGELEVGRKFDNSSLGLSIAARNKEAGNLEPNLEARIVYRVRF